MYKFKATFYYNYGPIILCLFQDACRDVVPGARGVAVRRRGRVRRPPRVAPPRALPGTKQSPRLLVSNHDNVFTSNNT